MLKWILGFLAIGMCFAFILLSAIPEAAPYSEALLIIGVFGVYLSGWALGELLELED